MNKQIMIQCGFKKEIELVEAGKCPMCKDNIVSSDFKDEISVADYKITGLCQKCQDKIYMEGV